MARKASLKLTEAEAANTERLRVVNNSLKLRIDDLKTFDPLTDNQKLFFDSYKRGDYFVALHGVAGTGKTFCALYKALEEVMDKKFEKKPNKNGIREWVNIKIKSDDGDDDVLDEF